MYHIAIQYDVRLETVSQKIFLLTSSNLDDIWRLANAMLTG